MLFDRLLCEFTEVTGGFASGGILFASSGKKYAKNAAKTKVLDS